MRLGNRERFVEERVLRAQKAALADKVKFTAELRSEVERLAGEQFDYNEQVKAAEEQAERLAEAHKEAMRPIEHMYERIQDATGDMLADWEFSMDRFVSIAKRAAAEVATALAFSVLRGGSLSGVVLGVSFEVLSSVTRSVSFDSEARSPRAPRAARARSPRAPRRRRPPATR